VPCFNPVYARNMPNIRSSTTAPEYVNCGKCHGCKRAKARNWTIRLRHEASLYDWSEAITVTYADPHLPEGRSLDHGDIQRWLYSMRYHFGPFRYFMCGEYGDKNKRPHYHVVAFGLHIPERSHWMRAKHSIQCRSDHLERTWDKGHILFDEKGATEHAIKYVAGYVQKKLYGPDWSDEYDMWVHPHTGEITQEARLAPYTRMSLRPGIGHPWLQKHWRETYRDDTIVLDGREFRPPFGYDRWMATDHNGKCGSHCPDHMSEWTRVRHERYEKEQRSMTAKERSNLSAAHAAKNDPYEQRPFE